MDAKPVVPSEPLKMTTVFRCEEMVIDRNSGLPDEQTAAPDKFVRFTMHPNIEVLMCFGARQRDVHAFNNSTALGRGEQQGAEIDLWLSDAFAGARHVWAKENDCGLGHPHSTPAEQRQPCCDRRDGKRQDLD